MTNRETEFFYYDSKVIVRCEDSEQVFRGLMSVLRRHGYTVTKDERIERDYKILSKHHRYVSRQTPAGLFECKAHWYPIGLELKGFQNVVFENPNGGEYDFNSLSKMPFLIRMRFLHFSRLVGDFLTRRGIPQRKFLPSDASPLEQFNERWTAERFRRGPDGWPDESELRSWPQLTQDGVKIRQGMQAYCLSYRGRWITGRLYGGINGMWLMYDQNNRTLENHNARHYFAGSEPVRKGRVFTDGQRLSRFRRRWDDAIKHNEFDSIGRLSKVARLFLANVVEVS